MTETKSRMDAEILEMAEAQRRLGIMDELMYREIAVRRQGGDPQHASCPASGEEIRRIRRMSV